jgi:hypothetical protein
MNVGDKRWWVKIRGGQYQGLAQNIYYNRDLPFEVFSKYQWYFKYRAALYRVSHPKHYCEIESGSYDYIPTAEQEAKRLKDKIAGKKATITKYENKLRAFERNWNSLFPYTDYEPYQVAVAKIEKLKIELTQLINGL